MYNNPKHVYGYCTTDLFVFFFVFVIASETMKVVINIFIFFSAAVYMSNFFLSESIQIALILFTMSTYQLTLAGHTRHVAYNIPLSKCSFKLPTLHYTCVHYIDDRKIFEKLMQIKRF